MMGIFKIIFIMAMTCFSTSMNAEIYKWIDENGNTHFGDQPLNKTTATEINIDTESRAGITQSSGNKRERDLVTEQLVEDRKAREAKREKKQLAKKERRKLCSQYKKSLQLQLRSNSSYRYDSKGERIYYSTKQREKTERRLRKGVSKNCS